MRQRGFGVGWGWGWGQVVVIMGNSNEVDEGSNEIGDEINLEKDIVVSY